MKVDILGVKIDDINMDQALEAVYGLLKKTGKHYLVTPNPEFIVTAQSDPQFKKILNDADLSIPDGVGLKLSGKIKNTVSGTDLMERLIEFSAEKTFVVGFLGGGEGVAEKVVERLSHKYSNLKISFARSGDKIDQLGNVLSSKYYGKKHNTKYIIPNTDLLFVAFGHPKQEKWIAENLPKIPVKVAIGVGGAFDYFSGKLPRAPRWIRNLRLEWLFRLIIQPQRAKRQLKLLQYLWLLTRQ